MTDQAQTTEPAAETAPPSDAERAVDARRRRNAIAGAAAGVGVVAVLAAVFVGVQVSDGDEERTAPAAATAPAQPQQPAETAPPAPAAPQVELDPALQTAPVVRGGTGRVSKLVVKPLITGTGPALTAGQTISANYVGVTYADGKVFGSSWQDGQKLERPIGVGALIPAFDEGLVGVPVGSRVQLDVPAEMAYGDQPEDPNAPAGDLRFVVDILAAR